MELTFDKKRYQSGFGTLLVATSLLAGASLISLTGAKSSVMSTKMNNNQNIFTLSFQAGEAGLSAAIKVLEKSNDQILIDSNSNGYIDNYTGQESQNVALTGGNYTQYSFQYSNPTSNNFKVIKIVSDGLTDSGTSMRKITAHVLHSFVLKDIVQNPITGGYEVEIENSTVTNNEYPSTAIAGDEVEVSGSTITGSTGGSGITEYDSDIANDTEQQFYNRFLDDKTEVKDNADYVFTGVVNAPDLNGIEDAVIWIDNSVNINGSATIGSADKPVVIIVNGNADIIGNVKIYGFIYVSGNFEMRNGVEIIGAGAAKGEFELENNVIFTYDSTVLKNIRTNFTTVALIPGTWHDF